MNALAVAILLLTAALVVHLVEEVRTGFRHRLPIGEMPLPVFVGINVVVYTYCSATLALTLRGSDLAVPLAWGFAVAMVVNGMGHIGIMLWRRAYFPGGASAVLLLAAAGYLLTQLLRT